MKKGQVSPCCLPYRIQIKWTAETEAGREINDEYSARQEGGKIARHTHTGCLNKQLTAWLLHNAVFIFLWTHGAICQFPLYRLGHLVQ